jgi:hypothetical protein
MALEDKEHATFDRVLVLKPIEGKKPLNTLGAADPRLFTGENTIHGVRDKQTCLWRIHYEKGLPPPKLRNKFTSFSKLFDYARDYFKSRNVEITEVKNVKNSNS